MFFKKSPKITPPEKNLEKWVALGNDFLITKSNFTQSEIIKLCDRNFGIGADQFIIMNGNKIQIFNADGTEAGMCANALKCVTQIASRETSSVKHFTFELKYFNIDAEIEEGTPIIKLPKPISFIEEGNPFLHSQLNQDFVQVLKNPQNSFFFVDIGNPHLICVIESSRKLEDEFFSSKEISESINYFGNLLQKSFLKTGGVNVSFVIVENRNNIFVRTYERGVGETLSCGSASVASAFITSHLNLTANENIRVFNKGSEKVLAIQESYHQISITQTHLILKGKGEKVAKVII